MRALLLLPLLAVLAFAQAPPERREPVQFDDAARTRCEAQGGRVATAGLSGDDMCALPYADAGRSCTDGSQCMGDCLLDEASLGGKPPRHGSRAVGQCQALAYPYGCRNLIEDGRLTLGLCVD